MRLYNVPIPETSHDQKTYICKKRIMENIKQQIQADFIQAMKQKDESAKKALGNIKTKITETEKKSKKELSNEDVVKVISSAIKQQNQSVEEYTKAGRIDLAEAETKEIDVLQKYMPQQMTEEEVKTAVAQIMGSMQNMPNEKALVGRTIGEFNKKYVGRVDVSIVKKAAEEEASNHL